MVRTVVATSLSPPGKAIYSAELRPKYAGLWVIVKCYANGVTYRVRDSVITRSRQVTETSSRFWTYQRSANRASAASFRVGLPVEPRG